MQKVLNKTVRGKEGRKADVYCFWSMVIKKNKTLGKEKAVFQLQTMCCPHTLLVDGICFCPVSVQSAWVCVITMLWSSDG